MRPRDPLSTGVYLSRSVRHWMPEWLAMSLATSLLVLVITPTNTFRATTLANLRALESFTGVTPERKPAFDASLSALLDANPAQERRFPARIGWVRYPMLIGETFSPLLLISPRETPELLDRARLSLVAGRLPRAGRAEILLHEEVARANDLRLGSRAGTLVDRNEVGQLFEVVGLLRGNARLAVGTAGSGLNALFLNSRLPSYVLVYARPGQKATSDAYLHAARDGEGLAFRVVDAAYVRERSAQALKNLPVLVSFLTLATSAVVALVVALLSEMAFRGRADEFALLLALGHRRSRLTRRLLMERGLLAGSAWVAGVLVGLTATMLYNRSFLFPRGIVMQVPDPLPIALSVLVPTIATGASILAVWRTLRRTDPVAVIERRFT